jgi:hypothetical protein
MNLPLPSFVEALDAREAIELAPAKAYLKNAVLLDTAITNPLAFERSLEMSMEDYLSDGLHLKDPSYAVMFDLVMEGIKRRWPEIFPQNMQMPVEWWGEIVKRKIDLE